jgi:hypothetical protein
VGSFQQRNFVRYYYYRWLFHDDTPHHKHSNWHTAQLANWHIIPKRKVRKEVAENAEKKFIFKLSN